MHVVQEFATHATIWKVDAQGNGGYSPALNSYYALNNQLNAADEAQIPAGRNQTNLPTLFVGATVDPLASVEYQNGVTRTFSKQPVLRNVSTGHWPPREQPVPVNCILKSFFWANGRDALTKDNVQCQSGWQKEWDSEYA